MTISIWRYSHLVLAVSCFLFLAIASVTGIILGVDAAMSPRPQYASRNIDTISLNVLVPRLQANYLEINSLSVEDHQYVVVKGLDNDGKEVNDYIDPSNGKPITGHKDQSAFIQSVTSFHRSLFLHETGRFFIGLTSFLLILITVSGIILVIKQQKSIKRFFASFSKEYFSQYYHVFLGRLSLVPILIISLTGTYLSLVKFNIFPEKKIELKAPARANQEEEPEQKQVATFASFKTIKLKDIRSVDFPFADDPDEYYKIKLTDRELMVNQFDGTIVASAQYPMVNILNTLSLNLHTGKTSTIWAIVLTLATINILFFIYSGFVITLRRRRNKIKNKYNITEAEYLLLVASENGSTIHFANHILTQLLSHGEKAHLAELNDFQLSENTQQLLIFASTFGLGDAPTNGNNFLNKLEETDSHRAIEYTIIGFGSTNYPDFCGYAKRIEEEIKTKEWATPLLPLYKVNDRSLTDFVEWVKAYSDIIHLPLITSPNYYAEINQRKLYSFTVADISATNEGDKNFMLTLTPSGNVDFSSGDLLAIYPENNEKERLYSIGKSGKNVRLVVKLHEQGLGSSYLNNLKKGDTIKAAIQSNNGFHLDKKQTPTILVSNGTGIAPFLGMLEENKDAPISVYAGFRNKEPLQLTIEQQLAAAKNNGKLKDYTIAYSRDADISHKYVYELVEKDIVKITQILDNGGVLMICGAIAMHKEVVGKLQQNCPNFELYQSNNQIRSDCY